MAIDRSRFPLLGDNDFDILAHGREVLVFVGAAGVCTIYFPTAAGDATLSGLASDERDQFIAAAEEVGAIVVDARSCDFDTFLHLVIAGPMPAIGAFKEQKIDGQRHALAWISAADYARSFAAIGARVVNVPERYAAVA